jgi:peptidoglycan biosynthesis protein MviN/MurJ (putative lipid II flippase)
MNETLVTPQVSTLARFAATKQWEALQTLYRRQRWRVTIAAGALTSVIVVIATSGQPWLPLLVSSPQTAETIRRLVPVLGCLSGIVATASLSHSLTTAFYAIGDTHTPSRVGAAMYTVGLAAKIAGAIGGGLQGIALAITATHVCNWLALEYAWARGLAGPLPRPSAVTT